MRAFFFVGALALAPASLLAESAISFDFSMGHAGYCVSDAPRTIHEEERTRILDCGHEVTETRTFSFNPWTNSYVYSSWILHIQEGSCCEHARCEYGCFRCSPRYSNFHVSCGPKFFIHKRFHNNIVIHKAPRYSEPRRVMVYQQRMPQRNENYSRTTITREEPRNSYRSIERRDDDRRLSRREPVRGERNERNEHRKHREHGHR